MTRYAIFFLLICVHPSNSFSKNFLDYCQDTQSSPQIQHTVHELKKTVFTENCQEAWSKLRRKTEIYLQDKDISSLKPLEGFERLRILDVWGNHIQDLDGIETLSNLTQLWIGDNSIENISLSTWHAICRH